MSYYFHFFLLSNFPPFLPFFISFFHSLSPSLFPFLHPFQIPGYLISDLSPSLKCKWISFLRMLIWRLSKAFYTTWFFITVLYLHFCLLLFLIFSFSSFSHSLLPCLLLSPLSMSAPLLCSPLCLFLTFFLIETIPILVTNKLLNLQIKVYS